MREALQTDKKAHWAISMENSMFHEWDEDYSSTVFDWSKIFFKLRFTPEDLRSGLLMIGLVSEEASEVTASSIYNLKQVIPGDVFIGFYPHKHRAIKGVVKDNTLFNHFEEEASDNLFAPNNAKLDIEWDFDNPMIFDATSSPLMYGQLLSRMEPEDLSGIENSDQIKPLVRLVDPLEFDERTFIENLQIGLGKYTKTMFKRSVSSDTATNPPFFNFGTDSLLPNLNRSRDSKDNSYFSIDLFYATSREKIEKYSNIEYGTQLSENLHFGNCTVSIPADHEQGKIERPWKLGIFSLAENAEKHVVVREVEELLLKDFIDQRRYELANQKDKSALLFIHGYKNTFSDVARRTAQIAFDVPFEGLTGFFSWPSLGKTSGYFKDIELADASIKPFECFLKHLVVDVGIEQLHIIAHSMGNRLLSYGLKDLSQDSSFSQYASRIKQVILAAPDIDQRVFKSNILPYFKNMGLRRTLYASKRDKALSSSEFFRSLPRLGDAGKDLFVEPGIDTVDTSVIKSGIMNHSYAFDTKELLTDLHLTINQRLAPEARRLWKKSKSDLSYWLFPR
ncbi:MAG: alpha/beta hydrolase [Reichenbachiella sp.]|uniref:alpha/beta hydrolase n=1 Tax=Reichenbachiella sp. TaxID=2184521 RepID=UPI0032633C97